MLYARYLQVICTLYAPKMHAICTPYARYMHPICTPYAPYLHAICIPFARHMHPICTLYACCYKTTKNLKCTLNACSLQVKCMLFACILATCKQPAFPMHIWLGYFLFRVNSKKIRIRLIHDIVNQFISQTHVSNLQEMKDMIGYIIFSNNTIP